MASRPSRAKRNDRTYDRVAYRCGLALDMASRAEVYEQLGDAALASEARRDSAGYLRSAVSLLVGEKEATRYFSRFRDPLQVAPVDEPDGGVSP